jgi:hypothetical protein
MVPHPILLGVFRLIALGLFIYAVVLAKRLVAAVERIANKMESSQINKG